MLLVLEEERVCQVGRRGGEGGAPCQVAQARVRLPLAGVVVEVRDQTQAQGVGGVQALDDAQVAGRLSQALPEAQAAVVHRQGVSVKIT